MGHSSASPPSHNGTSFLNISQVLVANLSEMVTFSEGQGSLTVEYTYEYVIESAITIPLLTTLLVVFSVLVAVAAYVLSSKGIKQKPIALMLMALAAMWVSAVVYWVFALVFAAKTNAGLRAFVSQNLDLWSDIQRCTGALADSGNPSLDCQPSPQEANQYRGWSPFNNEAETAYWNRGCAGSVALTINVAIGDAIVWWRAMVLWPDSRLVRLVCVVMISLATVMGGMSTTDACTYQHSLESLAQSDFPKLPRASMFTGDLWGAIAVCVSLTSNLTATMVIAYCAWKHRRTIMSYLQGPSRRSQVERTLYLLVESGLLYCALWVVIGVYTFSYYVEFTNHIFYKGTFMFTEYFYYVINGGIVPLIGMYPTLIIIVCAIDKSLYEKSLLAHHAAQSISLAIPPADVDSTKHHAGCLSGVTSITSATYVTQDAAGGPLRGIDNIRKLHDGMGSAPNGRELREIASLSSSGASSADGHGVALSPYFQGPLSPSNTSMC